MRTTTAVHSSEIFMFDPDVEKMPRAALSKLQTTRLRETLDRAYAHVPHYRKKFEAAKVKPADLKSLADIARFPFTQKTDLLDRGAVLRLVDAKPGAEVWYLLNLALWWKEYVA